jgi:biopolymer transport protein ExbB
MKSLIFLQATNLDTSSIQGTSTESFIDLAIRGGWVMLPIVLLSFIAVYIFFRALVCHQKGRQAWIRIS